MRIGARARCGGALGLGEPPPGFEVAGGRGRLHARARRAARCARARCRAVRRRRSPGASSGAGAAAVISGAGWAADALVGARARREAAGRTRPHAADARAGARDRHRRGSRAAAPRGRAPHRLRRGGRASRGAPGVETLVLVRLRPPPVYDLQVTSLRGRPLSRARDRRRGRWRRAHTVTPGPRAGAARAGTDSRGDPGGRCAPRGSAGAARVVGLAAASADRLVDRRDRGLGLAESGTGARRACRGSSAPCGRVSRDRALRQREGGRAALGRRRSRRSAITQARLFSCVGADVRQLARARAR